MRVEVHLYTQSNPVIMENVTNAYQKGAMYCVMIRNDKETVYKFPLEHIFRIKETKTAN